MDERTNELIQKYLDGALSDDELAKLQARIVKDRAVAESFAQATRMDAALTSMMRDDAAIRDLTLSMQQIEDGATPQPASTMSRDRRYTSTIVAWSTISAAVLILAGGFALWWSGKSPSGEPAEVAGAPHSVISGQVFTNGSTTERVQDGTTIRVAETSAAVIRLSDGSEAELQPHSRAVLHGRQNNLRQVVELVDGSGTFRVTKADGQFRVDTQVGSVTALGTEFTVALIPDPPREGERKNRRTDALQVEVAEGIVEVEYGRHKLLMAGGEEHLFRDDREPAPAKMVAGRFQSVDLAKHELRIASNNESRRITTHRYAPELTVTIDGQRSRLGDLRPSTSVALTLSLGETVVAVRTVGRKQTGVVRSIDPVGRTIVLAGGRREDGRSQDQIFNLSNTLHVLVDGREAALNEIRPQQRVELEFSVDESQVRRITSATRDREGEKE